MKRNPVKEAMESYWGKNCKDYYEKCAKCKAWKIYNEMEKQWRKK